jgi:RNA-directed DNA polymerase
MDVQRWILRNVLSALESHQSSYAYQQGRSILCCAEAHLNSRWLVKMDIHDFFGSVRERRVYPVFLDLGYPRLLSFEMARLCTRSRSFDWIMDDVEERPSTPYRVFQEGRLPQGAPTSGALANAARFEADARLEKLARIEKLVYTRYSDDLIFSAGSDFSRERATNLVRRVAAILEQEGFSPHRAKTRVIPPGARHVVLGLLLAEGRVHLLPEFKRRVEVHIRGVAKFGAPEHARHRHFDSVLAMINHIDGCIAFAEGIDPLFAVDARESWNSALKATGYPSEL